MDIGYLLALVALFPALLYAVGRYAGKGVWGLVVQGYERRGEGAYRSAKVPVFAPGKAPWSVKFAAITSFLLGQMIVPGGLAALVGLLVSLEMLSRATEQIEPLVLILTLSAPSGMFVAGGLLAAGMFMLRRDPSAAKTARQVARLSIAHNVVLILVIAGVALLHIGRDDSVWFPVVYGFVSIAQALLLRVAANALDARAAEPG